MIRATSITPEWLKARAKCLRDQGLAFRPHAEHPAIEVKSLHTNEWMLLTLPGDVTEFSTTKDRDQIYNSLQAITGDGALERWERNERKMHDALMDGHPNPEGYMEKWYAENPRPDHADPT